MDGVYVVPGFLTAVECRRVMRLAIGSEKRFARVNGPNINLDSRRVKDVHYAGSAEADAYIGEIGERVRNKAAELFALDVARLDRPQLLRYDLGGHYRPHTDAVNFKVEAERYTMTRAFDRDISTVLYLNEGFEGGEFEFLLSGLRIKPAPGLLIAFPSGWRHYHGVHPVTRGTRYVIADWFKSTPALVPEIEVIEKNEQPEDHRLIRLAHAKIMASSFERDINKARIN